MATWDTKIVITQVPGHPPGSELGQNDRTMSPDVLPCPKAVKINYIRWFLDGFGGVIKLRNSINREPVYFP